MTVIAQRLLVRGFPRLLVAVLPLLAVGVSGAGAADLKTPPAAIKKPLPPAVTKPATKIPAKSGVPVLKKNKELRPVPDITGIAPAECVEGGGKVTVSGKNFGEDEGPFTLYLVPSRGSTSEVDPSSWSDRKIEFTLPAGTEDGISADVEIRKGNTPLDSARINVCSAGKTPPRSAAGTSGAAGLKARMVSKPEARGLKSAPAAPKVPSMYRKKALVVKKAPPGGEGGGGETPEKRVFGGKTVLQSDPPKPVALPEKKELIPATEVRARLRSPARVVSPLVVINTPGDGDCGNFSRGDRNAPVVSGRVTDLSGLKEIRVHASRAPGAAAPVFSHVETFGTPDSPAPTEENFAYGFDLGTAMAGEYIIRVEATDADGKRGGDSAAVRHDPGLRTLTLLSPAPGSSHKYSAGESIRIEIAVDDVGCLGVEEVAIIVVGDTSILRRHPDEGDWFFTAPSYSVDTILPAGEYGLQLALHDAHGMPLEELYTATDFIVVEPLRVTMPETFSASGIPGRRGRP